MHQHTRRSLAPRTQVLSSKGESLAPEHEQDDGSLAPCCLPVSEMTLGQHDVGDMAMLCLTCRQRSLAPKDKHDDTSTRGQGGLRVGPGPETTPVWRPSHTPSADKLRCVRKRQARERVLGVHEGHVVLCAAWALGLLSSKLGGEMSRNLGGRSYLSLSER